MAPSKEHEDAVYLVKQRLRAEFNVSENSFIEHSVFGLRPDVCLKLPDGGVIVVEIGFTDAAKLCKYFKSDAVREIRWYTKIIDNDINLVARWEGDTLKSTRLSPSFRRTSMSERHLKAREKDIKQELADLGYDKDAFACCMGCGFAFHLKDLSPVHYYNRDYLLCWQCKDEGKLMTAGDVEFAVWMGKRGQVIAITGF